MPRPVTVGAPEQAAAPNSVELGLRGMAPIRPGSAVPSTPTPATTGQNTGTVIPAPCLTDNDHHQLQGEHDE
jgi:hypothetical protein